MKVEFQNTFLDFMVFNITHQFKNPTFQFIYSLLPAFILLIDYYLVTQGAREIDILNTLTKAFGWYVAIWVFQFVFTAIIFSSRKNKSFLTHHTVESQEDALFEETIFNKSYFFWRGIEKVVKMPTLIAIYIAQHQAILVPNRAFNSHQELDCFYKSVINRIPKSESEVNGWND